MAIVVVSGDSGTRPGELARMVAERLNWELVSESRLEEVLALGSYYDDCRHPLIVCAGRISGGLPGAVRVRVVAPESKRLDNLMADAGLTRRAAKARLRILSWEQAELEKRRFGQRMPPVTAYDLILNAGSLTVQAMVDLIVAAVQAQTVPHRLGASSIPESLEPKAFGHPSEEVFARLLDFHQIAWDYEPRSFPLQWDKNGKVAEAFTPDFYLPQFDLYVELTTMKQANVTRKNRKIRLLKAIYPHVNIQILYQKDVRDLVLKSRLPESLLG